ncbi:putative virion structural protein [Pseudomonas phage PA_LZ03]|nr:putative virion structural protein [Pseudomonas phage PA_LZ03]
MAFTVQNENGTVPGANAYVSVDEFKSFHTDRGTLGTHTDEQIEKAIILATDFLDTRYSFVGEQLNLDQGTQFPRRIPGSSSRDARRGLPRALKQAACLLAARSLGGATLLPDPTFNPGGAVVSVTKKVGPLETSTQFAAPEPGAAPATPQYPDVDLQLKNAKLLATAGLSRRVERG